MDMSRLIARVVVVMTVGQPIRNVAERVGVDKNACENMINNLIWDAFDVWVWTTGATLNAARTYFETGIKALDFIEGLPDLALGDVAI